MPKAAALDTTAGLAVQLSGGSPATWIMGPHLSGDLSGYSGAVGEFGAAWGNAFP